MAFTYRHFSLQTVRKFGAYGSRPCFRNVLANRSMTKVVEEEIDKAGPGKIESITVKVVYKERGK